MIWSVKKSKAWISNGKCLLAPPRGVAIRTYWPPLGVVNKNLLAPPRNCFVDHTALLHCCVANHIANYILTIWIVRHISVLCRSRAVGSCFHLQIPRILASCFPSLMMGVRPGPHRARGRLWWTKQASLAPWTVWRALVRCGAQTRVLGKTRSKLWWQPLDFWQI